MHAPLLIQSKIPGFRWVPRIQIFGPCTAHPFLSHKFKTTLKVHNEQTINKSLENGTSDLQNILEMKPRRFSRSRRNVKNVHTVSKEDCFKGVIILLLRLLTSQLLKLKSKIQFIDIPFLPKVKYEVIIATEGFLSPFMTLLSILLWKKWGSLIFYGVVYIFSILIYKHISLSSRQICKKSAYVGLFISCVRRVCQFFEFAIKIKDVC